MAQLTRYHLTHRDEEWRLEKEGSDRATVKAPTKKEAIKKMRAKVKGAGASVTIHRMDGSVQEERTYPRRADSATTTSPSKDAPPGSASTKAQADEAAEQAKEKAEQAKEKAGELAEQAKEQAGSQIAAQKDRATDSLHSLSTALRAASGHLHAENQGTLARYTDTVAERVGAFAELLRERNVSEVVGEAERYARREPALFLGGALVLGFFGGRFLKSSRPAASPRPDLPARP